MTISLSVFVCVCVRLWGVIFFSLEHSNNLKQDFGALCVDVSRVSPGCLKGVSWVFQVCFKGVMRVFKGVPRAF